MLGDGWEVAATATSLGVLPLFDRPTDQLSGGQAKRVALAKVLADDEHGDDDMVVLDEPTNHLDLEAIEWLESRLIAMKSALVLVTHDRHALDRLTTAVGPSRVVELDGGRCFVHHAVAGSSAYATYLDGAGRADRAGGEGGVDPQDPRPPGTRLAAPRCAGTIDEAQGPPAQRATRSSAEVRRRSACAGTTSNSAPARSGSAIRSWNSTVWRSASASTPCSGTST